MGLQPQRLRAYRQLPYQPSALQDRTRSSAARLHPDGVERRLQVCRNARRSHSLTMLNTLYSKLALALALLFCLIGLLFLFVMRMSFATYYDAVAQKLNRPMAAQLVSEHV